MQNQRQHWNKFHQEGKADHNLDFQDATGFALEVDKIISPKKVQGACASNARK